MLKASRIIYAALAMIIILATASSCAQENKILQQSSVKESPFKSFRDIPGVTAREIEAIEALQKERDSFVYGMTLLTESFINENGNIGGYAALFCEWLTGLFGIQFDLKIFSWAELREKLSSGEIDFSGYMIHDEDNQKPYYMTDYIAARQFIAVKLNGSRSFHEILAERPLR